MLESIDGATWLGLAQILGFVGAVVVCVRLRPWRWLLPFLRSGR